MNLETKYEQDIGLFIIDKDCDKRYLCSDKTDIDVLCEDIDKELTYIISRHNIMVKGLIKLEDNLKEISVTLEKLEEVKDGMGGLD